MYQEQSIGESLANFQAALEQSGDSLEAYIRRSYIDRWTGDDIYNVMAIRTTFVNTMHNYLTDYGLLNMERVSISPVTDPLAHDIEHSPFISYKGFPYMTTHSMIYSKLMACFNNRIKGIFVDSPNIRLELESPDGSQRGKYLIDFSQMDIEVKRGNKVSLDDYLNKPDEVKKLLKEDQDQALSFFEGMIAVVVSALKEKNEHNLAALGVRLEMPKLPFPRFLKDEAVKKYGGATYERDLGKEVQGHFFWVTGLMRENYDLIYPYLLKDGSRRPLKEFTSQEVYNYDLCIQSCSADGEYGDSYEVLSGGLREWLYEPIVERLLDNKIIKAKPVFSEGNITNIEELEGYGPFLMAASQKAADGSCLFPTTFGGGLGIERSLFALLRGKKVKKVDDVTFFGKNPDSHPLYIF